MIIELAGLPKNPGVEDRRSRHRFLAESPSEEPTLGTDFRDPEHPVNHKRTVWRCNSMVIVLIRQFKKNGELLRLPE